MASATGKHTVDIALIGASGRVGRRLLGFLAAQELPLAAAGLRLRLAAIANSRHCVLAHEGIAPGSALARLDAAPARTDVTLEDLLPRVLPRPGIVVDCTASAEVAGAYPAWLGAALDIVTPNKIGPSADRPLRQSIAAAAASAGTRVYDNTTVGAQLPLLATLRDLHRAGDRVERFEAVLSGTLSYVLGSVNSGAALSSAVRQAVDHGYAEPNPAGDLSGTDAARKLVILLRALGHDIDLGDVDVVPLVDAALLVETEPSRLVAGLAAADAGWRARAALAQARRERWIYRASFENGQARVAPERVADDHAFARLAPCENALVLHSDFYRAAPLTIAGPGAGIDLTAAGVFADLIAAAQQRCASSYAPAAVGAAA